MCCFFDVLSQCAACGRSQHNSIAVLCCVHRAAAQPRGASAEWNRTDSEVSNQCFSIFGKPEVLKFSIDIPK